VDAVPVEEREVCCPLDSRHEEHHGHSPFPSVTFSVEMMSEKGSFSTLKLCKTQSRRMSPKDALFIFWLCSSRRAILFYTR
jgi:hypothetical protein